MKKIGTFIAGANIPFNFDGAKLKEGDSTIVEISQNKRTIHIFKQPTTTGFNELTKTGDIYSGVLTSEMTSTMKGLYDFEITRLNGEEEVNKGSATILEIILESK